MSPQASSTCEALKKQAAGLPSMDGLDLVPMVTSAQRFGWDETSWALGAGYGRQGAPLRHVVAIDYGVKRNILRLLADRGCKVTVVPATASADDVLALKPDGVFLSNGPGDPAATGEYAVPVIRELLSRNVPTFGICLGHQMMALAVGAKTMKMHQGHHGANHPVKDFTTDKVEIVSMNHGFAVDRDTLPANAKETHVSLFDGSNCGIALTDRPAFSVQHHPEASPGPQDSHYLFDRFVELMDKSKTDPPGLTAGVLPQRAVRCGRLLRRVAAGSIGLHHRNPPIRQGIIPPEWMPAGGKLMLNQEPGTDGLMRSGWRPLQHGGLHVDRQGAGLLADGARGAGLAERVRGGQRQARRGSWPRRIAARCHAIGRRGASPNPKSPPFRTLAEFYPIESLQEALAEGISVGHEGIEMPEFQFSPAQIDDLTAYLKSINRKR